MARVLLLKVLPGDSKKVGRSSRSQYASRHTIGTPLITWNPCLPTMQANLLELSKEGNAGAIAALMNRHLQPKGITARVSLQGSCLKVMLDAIEPPDQQTFAPFVLRGIANLSLASVQTIQVYGRKQGEKIPTWTQVHNPVGTILSSQPEPESLSPLPLTNQAQESVAEPEQLEPHSDRTDLAAALHRFVNDEDITIKIEQQDALLKVIAQTDKFLEGPSFAKGIHQELLRLKLQKIETVEVYKQKRKGSHSFRIQSFTLQQEVPTPPEASTSAAQPTPQTTRSANPMRSSNVAGTQSPGVKKKENTNGIRKKLTIAFVGLVAVFVLFRLVSRLVLIFSSPMGYFSIFVAIFCIWRAWSFLEPLLQKLLRDE